MDNKLKQRNKSSHGSSFYIKNDSETAELLKIESPFQVTKRIVYKLSDRDKVEYDHNNHSIVYYISDIHLDHKIKSKFKRPTSKEAIEEYVYTLVSNLKTEIEHYGHDIIILIGGDVSFNFELSKIFYEELKTRFSYAKIIAIIGNHELWDYSLVKEAKDKKVNPVDYIVNKYRKLFNELDITFLENELLMYGYSKEHDEIGYFTLKDSEIINMTSDELLDKTVSMSTLILGGIGFSGYNPAFNAKHGIYRSTIPNIEEDLKYTKHFEKTYHKIKSVFNDKKVIVFTHMPKENWSKDEFLSNWIYVSGHTHRNYYENSDLRKIYADNQIGYHNKNLKFNYFKISNQFDVFNAYEDGVFIISRKQYVEFYMGYGNPIRYNRENTRIYLLKRQGFYMFIQMNLRTMKLSILKGGSPKKLDPKYDFNYYYDYMVYHAEVIKKYMKEYNDKLGELSDFIKSFGGTGKIHGSIVDIDYYNHLYLNPVSGEVIPYYATSMTNKFVYGNILSLINYKAPNLLKGYLKVKVKRFDNLDLLVKEDTLMEGNTFVPETDIYKFSNKARNLQYITQINVIRDWNYDILDSTQEGIKQLITRLIDNT